MHKLTVYTKINAIIIGEQLSLRRLPKHFRYPYHNRRLHSHSFKRTKQNIMHNLESHGGHEKSRYKDKSISGKKYSIVIMS